MKHQRGFTLLEILLVVAIIAMIAAGAVAIQSDRLNAKGIQRQTVERFSKTLEYAADWALLEKHAVGLRLASRGWSYFQPEKVSSGEWQWRLVVKHDFLSLSGLWPEPHPPEILPATDTDGPQIMILPDGTITPFTLIFSDETGTRFLRARCEGSLPLELNAVGISP
ncbi:type II secretion system minor pseudopilin GspH [Enterobacter bugandensis]|uniref:type II secretion system minor pseudopilin GspH n=1 Tax=Enterobacter bugandensis TaxID=881260 RepID=UPI0021D1FFAA|nr:type II secretion system minor pseudopilin GspH [Enterobacter bugandensis]MCU6162853.1 type II secretion system minor pseudopilin GspH [Enterobacter bugandensis]